MATLLTTSYPKLWHFGPITTPCDYDLHFSCLELHYHVLNITPCTYVGVAADIRPYGRHFCHRHDCGSQENLAQFGLETREWIDNGDRVLDLILIVWRDLGTLQLNDKSLVVYQSHAAMKAQMLRAVEPWTAWTTCIRSMEEKRARKYPTEYSL